MSVADKTADHFVPEVDPNPAEPRMVIWSTLRCLELQIDQHEELYDSHGVVSWELLKHMVRLAKRHAHEEGGKAEAAERETDQWRTRADEANAKLRETEQELDRLKKQLANAQRELSEQGQSHSVELQQETADLRKQLDAARAETVETRRRLNEETDRHRATNAEKIELFQQKESANQHNAELVKARDAANATILAQKAGNQYLRLLIDKVRAIMDREYDGREFEAIADALNDFNYGTLEPAPCPECERLRAELETANEHRTDLVLFVDKVRKSFRVWGGDESFFHSVSHALYELDTNSSATLASSPAPVAEPAPCPECELLRAFVNEVRRVDEAWGEGENVVDYVLGLQSALDKLDAGTIEPAPVAEPVDAEGGQ